MTLITQNLKMYFYVQGLKGEGRAKINDYFCINTLFGMSLQEEIVRLFFTASIRSENKLLFSILTWLQQRKQKNFLVG